MTRTLKRVVEGGLKLRLVRALVVLAIALFFLSWLIDYVARNELRAIRDIIDAELEVETVSISPFGHVEINNLSLKRDGQKFFTCKRIEMPFTFSSKRFTVQIGRTHIVDPTLHIFRKKDGKLNIDSLFKETKGPREQLIPEVFVTNGTIVLKERGFPKELLFSGVQIDVKANGQAYKVNVLGSSAWRNEEHLCRHFGIKGRLRTFDDMQLKVLLRDVHGSQIPTSWLDGGELRGSIDLKGKLERLWGTTVAVGELETKELHLKPGEGGHHYPTSFLDYKGHFALQEGKQSLRSQPILPEGGGVALDVTTRQGFITLCMDGGQKCLHLKAPSFNMTKAANKLSFSNIEGALLGSELVGKVDIKLGVSPTFITHFSLTGLDAKQLANVMPFPNFSLAGNLDLAGTVSGTFEAPTLKTKLQSKGLKVFIGTNDRNVIFHSKNLKAQAKYDGRLITLEHLSCAIADKTGVSIAGHYVPETGEDVSLELALKDVDFDDVERILGGEKTLPPLPIRPNEPVDIVANLYSSAEGPRAVLTVRGEKNTLRVNNRPLHTSAFTISAAMALPEGKLPESVFASTAVSVDTGGTIEARGTVPLVTTGPLDLSATVNEVDLGVLASFAPMTIVTGTGKVSASVKVEGRQSGKVHIVDANFKISDAAKLTLPKGNGNSKEAMTIGVKNLKGNAKLARYPDGLSLEISDLLSSLSRGGRLSLSAKYTKSTTDENVSAGFKLTKAELGEILDLFQISTFDVTGRGELTGAYESCTTTKSATVNFDFAKTTLLKKNGTTTYTLPINNLKGQAKYEETTAGAHFHVPNATAQLLGGRLSISGSNQLKPVVKPNVRFVLDNVELKSFCQTLGLNDFSAKGPIRVEGLLAGNIWWPVISARVIAKGPRLYWRVDNDSKYPLNLGKTTGHVTLRRDKEGFKLDLKDIETTAIDGSLTAKGVFRLTPKSELDVEFLLARATAKKLAALLGIDDFSFAGTLNAQAKLAGPSKHPQLTAKLRLDDARLFYRLKGVNIFYQPPHVLGSLVLDKEHLELSNVRGPIHDGNFKFRIHRLRRKDVLWNASLHFTDVSLHSLFSANLKQKNDIQGKGFLDIFFQGKGSDTKTFAGRGTFRVEGGAIRELEELRRLQKEYKLRNLIGVTFETLKSKVKLFKERLCFADAAVRSSKGNANGEVSVGFDRTLDGSVKVALNRGVLSSGHRLLSMLEGGKYFDFRVKVKGDIDKPDYKFSAKGVKRGVLVGGALLFSPIAPAAALIGGLQTLFGGKRRRRRSQSAPQTPATTPSP